MVMVVLGCLQSIPHTLLPHQNSSSCSRSLINNNCCNNNNNDSNFTRRKAIIFSASLVASYIHLHKNSVPFSVDLANAQQEDELEQEEERVVHVSQEIFPSVVFIKDLEIVKNAKSSDEIVPIDDEMAKVEGTGSGFIWDKFGHIILVEDSVVFLVDAKGNSFSREGKIIGFDPAYDLAVLKVDVEGNETKPVTLGTSNDLRVGQSCFTIGNPYGYENTLTTGVVSGLGREIPSPNGSAIRGAIQTDAAINAGNSGRPLIDSYGHVIGVNTATFTCKGTAVSSGVNFAIPIDTVVRTVPNLIVYGTPYRDRF